MPSKVKLPPYIKFRKSDPRYKEVMHTYFQGMFQSSWPFLVDAARSNLIHATVQTSQLTGVYQKFVQQNERPAVTLFLMNKNYQDRLSGPLLGTILSTAAALEEFLRLVVRIFCEKDLPKERRAKGPSSGVLQKIEDFNKLTAPKKLDHVYRTLLNRLCQDALQDEFKYFVQFRNDCFHADPVLRLATGEDETTKWGHRRPVSLSHGTPPEYPLLWSSNRPLSLAHALRAIRLHDCMVLELLSEPILRYICENDNLDVANVGIPLIEKNLAIEYHPKSYSIDAIAQGWEEVVETGLLNVPEEDRRLFGLELYRKVRVRRIK